VYIDDIRIQLSLPGVGPLGALTLPMILFLFALTASCMLKLLSLCEWWIFYSV